jgi:hypothetical protein
LFPGGWWYFDGCRAAAVCDRVLLLYKLAMPDFFNIIGKSIDSVTGGVMSESPKGTPFPAANGPLIEDQPLEIARGAALVRALAAVDERQEIR